MTTDLDNNLYKEDVDFQYDQLIQVNQRDKLPFLKQDDFIGINQGDHQIIKLEIHAPTIKKGYLRVGEDMPDLIDQHSINIFMRIVIAEKQKYQFLNQKKQKTKKQLLQFKQ